MLCFMVKLLTVEFRRNLFGFPFLFSPFIPRTYLFLCLPLSVGRLYKSIQQRKISTCFEYTFLGHLTTALKNNLQKQCSVPLSFHDSKTAPQGVNCFPPPTKPTADQLSPYSQSQEKFCIRNSKLRSPVG